MTFTNSTSRVENEEVVQTPQPVEAEAGANIEGNEGVTEVSEAPALPPVLDLQDPGEPSRDPDPVGIEMPAVWGAARRCHNAGKAFC